jgi:nicotinate (nicotinamide) nucleotide adenylyltransferase
MARIAIYGGAFDPPHLAHAFALTWLLTEVDAVWITPSARHAFGKDMSPWETRIGLVEALVQDFDPARVRICDVERSMAAEHSGPVYTWDTLSALSRMHPEHDFALVVGSDNLTHAERWHRFEALVERWPLYVLERPGHEAALRRFADAAWCHVGPRLPDISSTRLRAALGGRGVKDDLRWLSPAVRARAQGLYAATPVDAPSVYVFGAGGRAGRSLCAAFDAVGVPVVGRWRGRSDPWPRDLGSAEVVLLCVPDGAIGTTCERLRDTTVWRADSSVIHCAGRWGIEPLAPLEGRASLGAWHPLQSLRDPERAVSVLNGSLCAISGDSAAVDRARRLTLAVGGHPREIPGADRPLWHAAAVLAGNLPVVLLGLAVELLETLGLSEADARNGLLGLLRGALTQVERAPAAESLTGPLARGDLGTVQAHVRVLRASRPDLVPAYLVLGRLGATLLGWSDARKTDLERAFVDGMNEA